VTENAMIVEIKSWLGIRHALGSSILRSLPLEAVNFVPVRLSLLGIEAKSSISSEPD
jgi:hypothetical protein